MELKTCFHLYTLSYCIALKLYSTLSYSSFKLNNFIFNFSRKQILCKTCSIIMRMCLRVASYELLIKWIHYMYYYHGRKMILSDCIWISFGEFSLDYFPFILWIYNLKREFHSRVKILTQRVQSNFYIKAYINSHQ